MSPTPPRGSDMHYDVVVVGSRVAGASTALLLARAGHRVALVDRAAFPSDTLSTHLIWPAGIHLLQRWGLLDEIVSAGTPPLRTIRNVVDGFEIEVPLWPEAGVDAVYAPRRTLLDTTIVRAAERAGAALYEGVTVDGLSHDQHGRVEGVIGHDRDGRAVLLEGSLVVGADGWRSRVARDVEAATYREHRPSNAVHYAYWTGLEDRGIEFWYRAPDLMAGVFPTNGGACVYLNCAVERVPELRADLGGNHLRLMDDVAPDLVERLAGAERTSPVRGTPGLPGFLRQPFGPGWVLVGDAGCTKDPASAHGITAALRDADLAASAIDTALRLPDETASAMAAYHQRRDTMSQVIYDLSWTMAAYDWDAASLLDTQARYAAALVEEAQQVAGIPAAS